MDNFELKPERPVKRKPVIWNILTVLVLLVACGLAYMFFSIFVQPDKYLPANLRPPMLSTPYRTPTPTATIILLPSTWTPTQTIELSPTRTKVPTWTMVSQLITPTITPTPTIDPNAGTATATSTPMPAAAVITYQSVTTVHPDLTCNWMGVGGKVFDSNKKPLIDYFVKLGGTLNGKDITGSVKSGSNPLYGTSGFEFPKLTDKSVDSTQKLWIQLFDNSPTSVPLTEKIYFDTYADCAKNFVMVVFTKTR